MLLAVGTAEALKWLALALMILEGNCFAVAVCITAYRYCQSPTVLRLSSLMASLAVLDLFINANQWALVVLPVILIAPHVSISINHHRHFILARMLLNHGCKEGLARRLIA